MCKVVHVLNDGMLAQLLTCCPPNSIQALQVNSFRLILFTWSAWMLLGGQQVSSWATGKASSL